MHRSPWYYLVPFIMALAALLHHASAWSWETLLAALFYALAAGLLVGTMAHVLVSLVRNLKHLK